MSRVAQLPVLLALAVATAVLWEGGFHPAGRVVFAVLALVALIAAVREQPALAAALGRRPVVVVLAALGVLGMASALWTVGSPGQAARWGLVTLGYAAVAVAAGVLAARRGGVAALAAGIGVLAFISGVVGLVGATLAAGPFADHIGGAWRPGGTLEYSSALALLQVSALPVLLTGLRERRRAVRLLAAGGLAVAAAVLVLAESRLAAGLAVLVLVVAVVRAVPARQRRTVVLAGAGVLLLALLAGVLVDGGWHGRPAEWRAAWDVFAAHPEVGAGADAYLVASLPYAAGDPVAFAHDLPLELAAELGILGLLLGVALYASSGVAVWQARRTPALWLLGPAVLAFLASSLVDWPWHLAGSGAVWAAALGGVLGAVDAPDKR